jgi:catechol 2,3-dioxygenase-like lactoylglutathione lyase family enzyme
MATPILRATFEVAAGLLDETAAFYGERVGLRTTREADGVHVGVGESSLSFRATPGEPFYHVALLVPGDRFEPALQWAESRVALLPERESGEVVFDFAFWDALACYFHDPAGTIVELIAHRGIGEAGSKGSFRADELLGLSEVGIVGDPPTDAAVLERELGLEVWDGTVEGERSLAFVGEQARTLILCRAGRPWLPTGRPAEPHPVDVELAGGPAGMISLIGGSRVSRRGADASVQAS